MKPDKQLPEVTDVSAAVDTEGRDNITAFTFNMEPFQDGPDPTKATAASSRPILVTAVLHFNSVCPLQRQICM